MEGRKIMKRHPIVRQCLAFGIIFLLLGIAVQPVTSISITQLNELESINSLNNSYREKDCNCDDVNSQDAVEVNRLLDKTESTIKNILLTFGYIPDIKMKCNEFLKLLNTIDPDGPFCRMLEIVFYGLALSFLLPFDKKAGDLYDEGRYVLAEICLLFYACLFYTFFMPYGLIAMQIGCSWAQYYGPDLFIY